MPKQLELVEDNAALGLRVYLGSKQQLQDAGIGVGRRYPGDAGRSTRPAAFKDRDGSRVQITMESANLFRAAVNESTEARDRRRAEAIALSAPASIEAFREERADQFLRGMAQAAAAIFSNVDGAPFQFIRETQAEEQLLYRLAQLSLTLRELPVRESGARQAEISIIRGARAARSDKAFVEMLGRLVAVPTQAASGRRPK